MANRRRLERPGGSALQFRLHRAHPMYQRFRWDENIPVVKRGRKLERLQHMGYVQEYRDVLRRLSGDMDPVARIEADKRKQELEAWFNRRENPIGQPGSPEFIRLLKSLEAAGFRERLPGEDPGDRFYEVVVPFEGTGSGYVYVEDWNSPAVAVVVRMSDHKQVPGGGFRISSAGEEGRAGDADVDIYPAGPVNLGNVVGKVWEALGREGNPGPAIPPEYRLAVSWIKRNHRNDWLKYLGARPEDLNEFARRHYYAPFGRNDWNLGVLRARVAYRVYGAEALRKVGLQEGPDPVRESNKEAGELVPIERERLENLLGERVGNPGTMTLYHGSDRKFETFRAGKYQFNKQLGFGIHLTSDKDFAAKYGRYVYTVKVSYNRLLDETKVYERGTPEFDLGIALLKGTRQAHMGVHFAEKGVTPISLDHSRPERVVKLLKQYGFDLVKYNAVVTRTGTPQGRYRVDDAESYVALEPGQLEIEKVEEIGHKEYNPGPVKRFLGGLFHKADWIITWQEFLDTVKRGLVDRRMHEAGEPLDPELVDMLKQIYDGAVRAFRLGGNEAVDQYLDEVMVVQAPSGRRRGRNPLDWAQILGLGVVAGVVQGLVEPVAAKRVYGRAS